MFYGIDLSDKRDESSHGARFCLTGKEESSTGIFHIFLGDHSLVASVKYSKTGHFYFAKADSS